MHPIDMIHIGRLPIIRITLFALTVALAALILGVTPATAADITVDSDLDDDASNGVAGCSLREAVLSVNGATDVGGCSATGAAYGNNDLITVPTGVYTLTINEGDTGGRDLDIQASVVVSGAGAASTIVQADSVPATTGVDRRVFEIDGNIDVEFRDLTVRHGWMTSINQGAGIQNNYDASLSLLRVHVTENQAIGTNVNMKGGGIRNDGTLTVTSSLISDNRAARGGGLYHKRATRRLTITGTTFLSNSTSLSGTVNSRHGGGLYVQVGADHEIENSTFIGNYAEGDGGGIYNEKGSLNLNNVTVVSNTAGSGDSDGGGILNRAALQLTASRVYTNRASSGSGGGIANVLAATLVVTDASQIYDNFALNCGGVANLDSGTVATVAGSTVFSNTAANNGGLSGGFGGGICVRSNDAELAVEDSAIWANTAHVGGGIYTGISGNVAITDTNIYSNTAMQVAAGNGVGGGISSEGDVTISGGEIYNNHADQNGAGVENFGGTLSIGDGAIVRHNMADGDGGGIWNDNGQATLSAVQVLSNTATSFGGGIYNESTGAVLSVSDDSLIQHNRANDGGGIYNLSGQTILSAVHVISNTASIGGGISTLGSTALLSVSAGSLVQENYASIGGGGIYNTDGQAILSSAQVISNAANDGGGIVNDGASATLSVTANSLVRNNTAGNLGGGIRNLDGRAMLSNIQIVSNTADFAGGGLFNLNGPATLSAVTMLSNTTGGLGGGIVHSGGSVVLSVTAGSLMQYNRAGTSGGAIYNDSQITLTAVRVLSNTAGNGGALQQEGGGTSTITDSCIVGNSDTAVNYLAGTSPITASRNWWGASSGPTNAANPLGTGDSASANVDFSSFLTAPILGCPGEFGTPVLSIEKTVNEVNPQSNDTITYTVFISNGGDGPATNGVISDVIPTGLTYEPGSAVLDPPTAGVISDTPPIRVTDLTVNAGELVTLTFQASVNGALTDGLTITNTVSVTATNFVTPTAGSVTITVASLPVGEVTTELELAGMAITGFEAGGGGYGAGILDWVWTILNPGATPVSNIYFDIVQLDPTIAVVINADGGPAGAGGRVSVPNNVLDPADGQLDPAQQYAQLFEIGWLSYNGFTFQVQAYGVVGGSPLVAGEPQLLGTFTAEFDPSTVDVDAPGEEEDANQIFLPLIQR